MPNMFAPVPWHLSSAPFFPRRLVHARRSTSPPGLLPLSLPLCPLLCGLSPLKAAAVTRYTCIPRRVCQPHCLQPLAAQAPPAPPPSLVLGRVRPLSQYAIVRRPQLVWQFYRPYFTCLVLVLSCLATASVAVCCPSFERAFHIISSSSVAAISLPPPPPHTHTHTHCSTGLQCFISSACVLLAPVHICKLAQAKLMAAEGWRREADMPISLPSACRRQRL